jgi:outer membrane protein assembly factor BamB
MMVETSAFDRFDKYCFPEIYSLEKHIFSVQADDVIPETPVADPIETISVLSFVENGDEESPPSPVTTDGLMDSAWPMYCHDTRHTGRSPYSTVDNNGYEKWRCKTRDKGEGDVVIDNDGTIYIGSSAFHAVYPNGTMKWQYVTYNYVDCAPAIDENGVLYFGTIYDHPDYLYAFYPNGTLQWKYKTGKIWSSPAIGDDGTIYFGISHIFPDHGYITALYPNGTLKWEYPTDHVVYSSPAIGDDGIVYCGSHDTYLYALYPNNGTLKWRYKTGHWIRTAPCIADDGTIYVVSLDYYLHAVNPDGTMKWKTDVGAGTSPTIGQDGTIYAGSSNLHAINPTDGSVKWTFNAGGAMRGGTPCNSVDGTIYFGTHIGDTGNGELIAVNSDGTEKWRRSIGAVESAPAIGEDGTVYIGSNNGYLYAFGPLDPNAPLAPTITGLTSGKPGAEYEYTFNAVDPNGDDVKYHIDWGDSNSDTTAFSSSGTDVKVKHTWSTEGSFIIKATAEDSNGLVGPEETLTVTMLRNKAMQTPFLNFLQSHPKLYQLLLQFL